MHPKIKEFWEKRGPVEVGEYTAFQIRDGVKYILGRKINDDGIWVYYFYNMYYEKEMLKVIKMKVFI